MNKLIPIGILLLLGAVGTFAYYIVNHRIDTAKKDWPTVPGVITQSGIVKTQRSHLDSLHSSSGVPRSPAYETVTVWDLGVRYQYKVDGQPFESGQPAIPNQSEPVGSTTQPSQKLRELSAQLPMGGTVPVHYDPSDPSESYLLFVDSGEMSHLLRVSLVLGTIALLLILGPLVMRR